MPITSPSARNGWFYQSKVLEDKPAAYFDELPNGYLSLITDSQRNMATWTQSGCTATLMTNMTVPVPTTSTTIKVVNLVPGSAASLFSPVLTKARKLNYESGVTVASHILIPSNKATSVTFKLQKYTGTWSDVGSNTMPIPTVIDPTWVFFTTTFDLYSINTALKDEDVRVVVSILDSAGGISSDYEYYFNGFVVGQGADSCASFDMGASSAYEINSLSGGRGTLSVGVYDGMPTAAASGLPIHRGVSRSMLLNPTVPGKPSMTLKNSGFLQKENQNDTVSLEFWMKVGSASTETLRIVGPTQCRGRLHDGDGLYLTGTTLTLSLGGYESGYDLGAIDCPQLVHWIVSPSYSEILINGDSVIYMPIDSRLSAFDTYGGEVGFYTYDAIHPVYLASVATYQYAVPSIAAKIKFVRGQGTDPYETTAFKYDGKSHSIDFSVSEFATNLSYPDNASWALGQSENVVTTKTLSNQQFEMPSLVNEDTSVSWSDKNKEHHVKPVASVYYKDTFVLDQTSNNTSGQAFNNAASDGEVFTTVTTAASSTNLITLPAGFPKNATITVSGNAKVSDGIPKLTVTFNGPNLTYKKAFTAGHYSEAQATYDIPSGTTSITWGVETTAGTTSAQFNKVFAQIQYKDSYMRVKPENYFTEPYLRWNSLNLLKNEAVAAISATAEVSEIHKAMDIKSANVSAWNTNDVEAVLFDIRRLSLNTVTIPVRVAQATATSNAVTVDPVSLAFAQTLVSALPKGLRYIIEPYPWIANGTIGETELDPTVPATWFASYQAALLYIADVFPDSWGMYVASNLIKIEDETARWISLIAALRAVYEGQIIYRTNWWVTATWDTGPGSTTEAYQNKLNNALFGHPDIIAVGAYFELSDLPNPSVQQLESALTSTTVFGRGQNVYQEVMAFATQWNKPVFLGEIGIPCVDYGTQNPWNPDVSFTDNHEIQNAAIQAYVNVFSQHSSFLGFSLFKIGHPTTTNYTLVQNARESFSYINAEVDILVAKSINSSAKLKASLIGDKLVYAYSDGFIRTIIDEKTIQINKQFDAGWNISQLSERNLNVAQLFASPSQVEILAAGGDSTKSFDGVLYSVSFYNGKQAATLDVTNGVIDENIRPTFRKSKIGSYTLIPVTNFGNFTLDVASVGSWQNTLPLSLFTTEVSNAVGETEQRFDFIQINNGKTRMKLPVKSTQQITYGQLFSQYWGKIYHNLSEDYSTYQQLMDQQIAIHDVDYCSTQTWVTLHSLNKRPPLFTEVDAKPHTGSDIVYLDVDEKREFVQDGYTLAIPYSYGQRDYAVTVYQSLTCYGQRSAPLKVKSLELASWASPSDAWKALGTQEGNEAYPYSHNGNYYVLDKPSIFEISKRGANYLYKSNRSGIRPKPLLPDGQDSGIAFTWSRSGTDDERALAAVSFFVMIDGDPTKSAFATLTIGGNEEFYIEALPVENKNKYSLQVMQDGTPYGNTQWFINGEVVGRPYVKVGEWTLVQLSFASPIDSLGQPVHLRVSSAGTAFDNVTFQGNLKSRKFGVGVYRRWSEVAAQTWSYWAGGYTWYSLFDIGAVLSSDMMFDEMVGELTGIGTVGAFSASAQFDFDNTYVLRDIEWVSVPVITK